MPIRKLPGQPGDQKSRSGERNQDKCALRPRPERGNKGRNFVRRQVAEKAVVRAEADIQRYHDAKINRANGITRRKSCQPGRK